MAAKGEHLLAAGEIAQRARDAGKGAALAFAEQRHRGGAKATEFADDLDLHPEEYKAAGVDRDLAYRIANSLRRGVANATVRHRGVEYAVPTVTTNHVTAANARVWRALKFGFLMSLRDSEVVPTRRLVLVAGAAPEEVARQYPKHALTEDGVCHWLPVAEGAEIGLPGATVVWDSSDQPRVRIRRELD